MIDTNEFILKKDEVLESGALCHILLSRAIPAGLHAGYFTDARRQLFDAMILQWAAHREIDPTLLRPEHVDVMSVVLNNATTSCGESVIEKLHSLWLDRQFGELLERSSVINDPLERLRFIREASSSTEIKNQAQYDQTTETSLLVEALAWSAQAGRAITGHAIGIEPLDLLLNGFEPGKMYLIGGLKKTGKSRFMVFCAAKLAEQGCGILIDSLEMNAVQLNSVLLAHYSGIDSRRLGCTMTADMLKCFNVGASKISQFPWSIYREYSPEGLYARIEHERTRRNVDIVFVDFAQRMRVEKFRADRTREVEFISQRLADMSRELNITVILLSQLSGAAENLPQGEVPSMIHYKESQGLPENADAIVTLHNSNRNETQFTNTGSYKIQDFLVRVEQRYGISGNTIGMCGDLRTAQFWDKRTN